MLFGISLLPVLQLQVWEILGKKKTQGINHCSSVSEVPEQSIFSFPPFSLPKFALYFISKHLVVYCRKNRETCVYFIYWVEVSGAHFKEYKQKISFVEFLNILIIDKFDSIS